jgi:hypothetical protein
MEQSPEYKKGFNDGYDDKHIPYYLLRSPYYTEQYIKGYRDGKKQIDEEVDDAAQSRV